MSTSTNIDLPAEDNSLPLSPPHSDDHPHTTHDDAATPPPESELSDAQITTRAPHAQKKKTPSTRFDFRKESVQELILLRALSVHQPFVAAHGTGAESWGKVVEYLHETDRAERPTKPFFTNVKIRTCKLTWERIAEEQKAYEAYLKSATGIAPEESERRQLMEELYGLKKANTETLNVAREDRTKQQENAVEERRLGQLLLASAESGETRGRTGSDSESSCVSTRYSRKRVTIQQLEKHQQEATQQVKDQRDLIAKQVELQKEDMEQRKQLSIRQEEREAAREARQEQREIEKEQRLLDWEREKQRSAEAREKERQDRQDDIDERRHKEVLDIFKQQSMTNQLLAQVIMNMQQKS